MAAFCLLLSNRHLDFATFILTSTSTQSSCDTDTQQQAFLFILRSLFHLKSKVHLNDPLDKQANFSVATVGVDDDDGYDIEVIPTDRVLLMVRLSQCLPFCVC